MVQETLPTSPLDPDVENTQAEVLKEYQKAHAATKIPVNWEEAERAGAQLLEERRSQSQQP